MRGVEMSNNGVAGQNPRGVSSEADSVRVIRGSGSAEGNTAALRDVSQGKGLASGRIGLATSTVIGLSSTAPMYSLATTLGFVVVLVGVQAPVVFIAAFIPMLLTAFAYKELSTAVPDSGTAFTWAVKAFTPKTGWLAGWGVVVAGVVVMANQTEIAARYLWLLIGDGAGAQNMPLVTITGVSLIAVMTWVSLRNVESGNATQWVLILIQYSAAELLVLAMIRAVVKGVDTGGVAFSWEWFNPLAAPSLDSFIQGVLMCLFIYWGWDTCLAMSEETKDPLKTPGRAAILSSALLVTTYVGITVVALMYAGAGSSGQGLANPEQIDDVFFALKDSALGSIGWVVILAVAISALATCQTTIIPTARGTFAMAVYKAVPARFGDVHPRHLTPSVATIGIGVISAVYYVMMKLISDSILEDTVAATSVAVASYYCITSFACIRYFKNQNRDTVRNFVFRLIFPLIGGTLMAVVLVYSLWSMLDPSYGETSLWGVSGVFVTVVVALGLGLALMGWCARRAELRPFFDGRSLNRSTEVRVPE